MTERNRWIISRQPTAADGDLHGLVRWGIHQPGLLMAWQAVRPGEPWAHSAAWKQQEVQP